MGPIGQRMGTGRTLVIGYGNVDRSDDGVGHALVAALRHRLGQPPLGEYESGLEDLGAAVDSVFVLQLSPDLLDVAASYDRLIFVDAHVRPDWEDVHCTSVQSELSVAGFTHHVTPGLFMALLQAIHQREPMGFIASVRGHEFEFRRGLSNATAAQIAPALERILSLAEIADPILREVTNES